MLDSQAPERWGAARDRVEVLVLEDNPGDARLLGAEFSTETLLDVRLTVAPRLSEGLQLLASREFDAVLLDLNLPDSQGMDTFQRLRAAVPEVPLIVYTGLQDDEIAVRALRGGAQDYVVKGPGMGPLLIRAVSFAIERHRVRVELDLRAARLEKNQGALRHIIEASADVIMIVDHSGAVRFVNPGAERMYGRSAAELMSQAGGFALRRDAAEIDIRRPDGTARTADVRSVEIEWEGEAASLISLHDVTGAQAGAGAHRGRKRPPGRACPRAHHGTGGGQFRTRGICLFGLPRPARPVTPHQGLHTDARGGSRQRYWTTPQRRCWAASCFRRTACRN